MRTCLLLLCQGHRDQDDTDRLRHDPALAAAAKSSGGPVRAMEAMAWRPSRRYRDLWIS